MIEYQIVEYYSEVDNSTIIKYHYLVPTIQIFRYFVTTLPPLVLIAEAREDTSNILLVLCEESLLPVIQRLQIGSGRREKSWRE